MTHNHDPYSDADALEGLTLGQATVYQAEYDASLLQGVPRKLNRDAIALSGDLPFHGTDIWTGYELSWLNAKGKPVVALLEVQLDINSANLIESKSFKLYLNSFNQTRLADRSELESRLLQDLSEGFGAPIEVRIYDVMNFPISQQSLGLGIDDLDIEVSNYSPNSDLLTCDGTVNVEETLHSHLLKSNCPVTGQPDWATLVIRYEGSKIHHESLLQYIISYRNHDDFHEHCVEQIFCDLLSKGQFKQLSVTARYTRRGGLDINPTRSLTSVDSVDGLGRLARQ